MNARHAATRIAAFCAVEERELVRGAFLFSLYALGDKTRLEQWLRLLPRPELTPLLCNSIHRLLDRNPSGTLARDAARIRVALRHLRPRESSQTRDTILLADRISAWLGGILIQNAHSKALGAPDSDPTDSSPST